MSDAFAGDFESELILAEEKGFSAALEAKSVQGQLLKRRCAPRERQGTALVSS